MNATRAMSTRDPRSQAPARRAVESCAECRCALRYALGGYPNWLR